MHCFGSYLGSGLISYAADEQDEVKFDAKILNAENEEVTQADITTELKLHLNIAVEEGTLKNINLNLDNCNFKLKDEKSIDQIKAGEVDLAIVAKNEDSFKLDLLNIENKIKLTAKYLKDNEISQIEKEKEIQLKWNSQNLNTMDEETRKETKILNTEIITNKTYTIDGEQKRVIQVKVKSGIKDNIYPIEKTVITINPIQEGKIEGEEFKNGTNIVAEDVTVSAYSTKATNGHDGSINFGTVEENKLGSWQYNSESGTTTITVNNSKDENNNVAWAKNAVDEFVVTYIYKEENVKDAKALKTEVENNIKLYTDEGEHTKTVSVWETSSEKEMLMELNVQAPESISKKYILQGKEFAETYTLNISTTKIGENILVVSNVDELNISDPEDVIPSTTFKTTYINKEEFLNILGDDGQIALVDMGTANIMGQITKDSIDEENENLLSINYSEDVNQLGIILSKPIKAGKINIQNIKTLNISSVSDYTDNIDKIEKLILKSVSAISDAEGKYVFTTDIATKEISLTNPQTNVELGLDLGQDKTTLPVGEENKINFTVTLHTSEDNSKLFNNPIVKIELPSQVKQASIVENTENILNANGLNLNGITINNNVIEIKLTGNQEEYVDYNGQDTTITFSANLKTSELLPTSTENIKLLVVNEEETAEDSKQVTFSAEKGILLANSISNYNGEEPAIFAFKNEEKSGLLNSQSEQEIIATGKGTIINNTGKNLENVVIIGKGNIKVAMADAEIAYTKDHEVTVESNWDVTEYSQEVTGYKIIIPLLENSTVKEFTYELTIPENLGAGKTIELQYSLTSETTEVASPKIILKTNEITEEPDPENPDPENPNPEEPNPENPNPENPNPEEPNPENPNSEYKLELTMESNVPTTQTLLPEQEITYTINVKNANTEEHRIIIEGQMPEGLIVESASATIKSNETEENVEGFEVLSNQEYYKTFDDVPANAIINITIKAYVPKYTKINQVETMVSAFVKLPNESGFAEDEEKCCVAKVEKSLKHNVKIYVSLQDIEIPEEITLKIGETKTINVKAIPEEASIENLKITVDDSNIVTVTSNGEVTAVAKGTTILSVFTEDRLIGKNCKINVISENEDPDLPDPIIPEDPIIPDPEDPTVEKTYSISGTAWFDENEDGIKDEKEKLLKGILVKIKQINKDNVAEYLKDAEGNQITAITDNQGKYEFKDLKPGKYIVEFEYNTKTYKLTPVTNKDSVPSAPTTSEGTTVKTDTLNVTNKNIENINIGLVLNSKFDLELNKYITKVTVKNNSGTTEYNYNNEQLAKVEIKAKQMASSTVLVEYVIQVKNNGAVPGTASVIVDYLPKGLKFSSEMNTNWYQGTDGNIYTEELKDEMLEPGETKQVKLILTKAMTENNTGTFTNGAEIYEDKNDFGLVDTNSTPANQEQKENDYSTAELIISTATGSPMMYIGIIITSMLVLGGGIYLINKKVILEKNI